jgi:hypothetical protein
MVGPSGASPSPQKIPPMKSLLLPLALLMLPVAAPAETVDLGTHGTFSIAVPKGWKLTFHKEEETGVAVTLSASASVNAKLLINVTYVMEPKPVSKDLVDEQVMSVSDQFVDQSVEKKKTLRNFNMSGSAYGAYCVFTDASLVGQAPKTDEFKVIGIGVIHFTDEVMAAVSVAGDDEKGPDFAAMLGAVASAAVAPRK